MLSSINTVNQNNRLTFSQIYTEDNGYPVLTLFEKTIFDAILASGSTGMTTQDLRKYARNPTAAVTQLREARCNVVSIPLGPQYDPVMQRTVRNTVKYVIGTPMFLPPKESEHLH